MQTAETIERMRDLLRTAYSKETTGELEALIDHLMRQGADGLDIAAEYLDHGDKALAVEALVRYQIPAGGLARWEAVESRRFEKRRNGLTSESHCIDCNGELLNPVARRRMLCPRCARLYISAKLEATVATVAGCA